MGYFKLFFVLIHVGSSNRGYTVLLTG